MFLKFDDCFALGSEVIPDVEIDVQHFVETPSQICCRPLCMKHKNEIKIKFVTQHKTQWKMLMYACSMSLTDSEEIFPTKPIN
jgi:hypothetical protein